MSSSGNDRMGGARHKASEEREEKGGKERQLQLTAWPGPEGESEE